jgi:hypothetical protein
VAKQPLDPDVGCAGCDGHLRASAGDRELVIDSLKAAFAQGRLSQSELDRRAVLALESRTYAGLTSATAGIPPVTAGPRPAVLVVTERTAAPVRSRPANWKIAAWVVGLVIVLPVLSVVFLDTRYGSFFIMLSIGSAAAAALGSPTDRHRRHRRTR